MEINLLRIERGLRRVDLLMFCRNYGMWSLTIGQYERESYTPQGGPYLEKRWRLLGVDWYAAGPFQLVWLDLFLLNHHMQIRRPVVSDPEDETPF